ncbi:MAG: phosphatase PAP2 family protein [Tannerellaceae bacterium]|jgi:membrane-associated phospholipid phosphatase|nr:phosphatase PAP2 family protein [Tannerellaceae bacterium]
MKKNKQPAFLLFLSILLLRIAAVQAETTYISPPLTEDSALSATPAEKMPAIPYKFKPTQLILPAALITTGIVGTAIDGWGDYRLYARKDSVRFIRTDDYLEWGMLGWVFVCDLMGKEKHNVADQFFLVALAESLNAGMVQGLKKGINQTRPDGAPYSFPSGHTANAFLGAHVAFKEFKDSNPALACSGYAIAAFVAGSRVYKNRHWIADAVAGAGFGILSVELSYLIYFPIRNAIAHTVNTKAAGRLVVAPVINRAGGGLYLSFRF